VSAAFAYALAVIVALSLLGLPVGHAMIAGSILYLWAKGLDMGTAAEQLLNGMSPARQKVFQAAADNAIAWSAAEHLKREVELADAFRKQGLQVYVPDQNAFRAHAQKVYLASDEAKEWPKGMLEKINALK
jgi:TRAP-type C4-dicarboxylate transport system substrate-binding protein